MLFTIVSRIFGRKRKPDGPYSSNPGFASSYTVQPYILMSQVQTPSTEFQPTRESERPQEQPTARRHRIANSKESNNNDDRIALMIVALEGIPSVPEMHGYDYLFGAHPKVFKTLSQKGNDCHKWYHDRSAWDLVMSSRSAKLLKLFEECRGKPSPSSRLNGSNKSPKQREDSPGHESDNESNASTEAAKGDSRGKGCKRYVNTAPSSMSSRNGTLSRNEQQGGRPGRPLKPRRFHAEISEDVVYAPPPLQSSREFLPPRSSRIRHYNPFSPMFSNLNLRYDEDGDRDGYN
ncbi:hypothetical protein GGR58DRAFT_504821 [Xylaria digitata]|nr:hypothetical protein GGR58DRAFT_504821 [Xylaria digitata]